MSLGRKYDIHSFYSDFICLLSSSPCNYRTVFTYSFTISENYLKFKLHADYRHLELTDCSVILGIRGMKMSFTHILDHRLT